MNRSSMKSQTRLPATTRASSTRSAPQQRSSPLIRSAGSSTPTTHAAQNNGTRRAQDLQFRNRNSTDLFTQAALSERRHAEIANQSNAEIIRTLKNCMEETRAIAVQQEGLRSYARTLEEEIRMLNQELNIANARIEEKKEAEELNLKLQARILNLERMKSEAERTEPRGNSDSIELEEMRKQYRILEDHYHELLDYVRGIEDKSVYDNGSPQHNDN